MDLDLGPELSPELRDLRAEVKIHNKPPGGGLKS